MTRSAHSLDLPPVWLALFAALVWAQSRFLPLGGFGRFGDAAGTALIGVGLVLMAAAVGAMVMRRTTVIPHRDPVALVTGGVFRFSRNPIYLADVLILTGYILHRDAVLSVPLIPAFVLLISTRFIRAEEARLRTTFGAAFDRYAAKTRRWL